MSPLWYVYEGHVLANDQARQQVFHGEEDGNYTTVHTLVQSTICGGISPTTATTSGKSSQPSVEEYLPPPLPPAEKLE